MLTHRQKLQAGRHETDGRLITERGYSFRLAPAGIRQNQGQGDWKMTRRPFNFYRLRKSLQDGMRVKALNGNLHDLPPHLQTGEPRFPSKLHGMQLVID